MTRVKAVLLLFMASAIRCAAAPGLATQPTTRPAVVDLSSPDATIRSLANVLDQDDVNAYLRIMFGRSDDEQKMIAADARQMLLGQRLVKSIQQHIPDAKMDELSDFLEHFGMPVGPHAGDELRGLLEDPSIKWKVTGNDAVLGDGVPDIHLHRIKGQWRMVLPHDDNPIAENLKDQQRIIDAFENVLRRVDAGEVKNSSELGNLLYPPSSVATSRPTTRPSTP